MQLFKLPFCSNLEDGVLKMKEMSRQLVGGPFLIAFKYMQIVMNSLPYCYTYFNAEKMSRSLTLAYSNVAGPSNGFDFGLCKVTKLTSVGTPIGRSCNFFSTVSLNGTVTFSLMTCKGFIDEPGEFMDIFRDNLNEALAAAELSKKQN